MTRQLLDPEKVFRSSARARDKQSVEVELKIAKGYYMYGDRFSFKPESGRPLAEVEIPRGKVKEDEFFGKSETFRDLVRVRVPVSSEEPSKAQFHQVPPTRAHQGAQSMASLPMGD